MRKLVTLRKIKDLEPIKNADFIELAIIDGWKTVVKKGEFNIGDYGLYFEIDCLLPYVDTFSFVKQTKKYNGSLKYYIRTMKLRGQVSQGLMMHLEKLPEVKLLVDNNFEQFIDFDFAEMLGVVKYSNEYVHSSAEVKSNFPSYIKKTSEKRIQNVFSEYKEKYSDVLFYPTLKMDGSSMTIAYVNNPSFFIGRDDEIQNITEQFFYCSHDLTLKQPHEMKSKNLKNNAFHKVVEKYDIQRKLSDWCKRNNQQIAIQCELLGPSVNKNKERFSTHDIRCFYVYFIDKCRRGTFTESMTIFKELDLPTVICYEPIKIFSVFNSVDEILKFATGETENGHVREGLVFNSDFLVSDDHSPVSFKAISNKYLLKNKD